MIFNRRCESDRSRSATARSKKTEGRMASTEHLETGQVAAEDDGERVASAPHGHGKSVTDH